MESLKVLIPTDFSVQAEYAYLMVKKLEEKTPTEIHFIQYWMCRILLLWTERATFKLVARLMLIT
jgi:hypothetical protein